MGVLDPWTFNARTTIRGPWSAPACLGPRKTAYGQRFSPRGSDLLRGLFSHRALVAGVGMRVDRPSDVGVAATLHRRASLTAVLAAGRPCANGGDAQPWFRLQR